MDPDLISVLAGLIEGSKYGRGVKLNLSSNVPEAGQTDTATQAFLNCARSALNEANYEEASNHQHLKRMANEYATIKGTAYKIMKNLPVLYVVLGLVRFRHHENGGNPNLRMFKSWVPQKSHGPVRAHERIPRFPFPVSCLAPAR